MRKTLFSMRASLTGLLMLFAAAVSAQDITVRGSVTDATGDPAIGATIRVQGSTTAGTVTDVNGNFTITCSPRATLDVVYIGYEPQSVAVNGRNTINVVLSQLSTDLNEVVVVGYGTQKKVNVTGAVSMVGGEVLEDRPVTNVTQALQGQVPGLNFTTNTNGGLLNNTMAITIRGTGTIGNGSVDSPLILIDGIEGDINALNPNDIESVSVLKDAASASIYGTRAAFGVILITTKSGKGGKVRVNYSGDIRFSTATQLPKMVNSLQFAEYFNAANINAGGENVFSDETMERIKTYLNGGYTDPTKPEYYGTTAASNGDWNDYTNAFANTNWFDEFYKKNVPSTQHNLSLSGGNDNVSWLISGGYLKNNGLIRHGHDELDRYNMNAKINAKLAPWVRVEYSTKWSRQNYEQPQYLTYWSNLFFHNIARRWPTCPIVDPNGHWFRGMEIEELENGGVNKTRDDMFTQQLNFTFTPLEGWNIYANGALRSDFYKSTTSVIPINWWNVNNVPSVRNSDYGTVTNYTDYRYEQDYYAINLYTDYTRSFGKHNGKVLLGVNYEKYKQNYMEGYGANLTTPDKPYLSQTQSNPRVADAYWHRATAGYFGRLNYDYDGIYLFEFNLRYDGSSRFTSDKRWAWFPSVSVGWNIARENFFQNLTDQISTLKLRASWGQLGNTNSFYNSFADWYPFYQQQAIGAANSSWLINGSRQNTASLPNIVNSSMTWETVETWDIGLDFAALNNRLTGSFDYYVRTTKDMIGPAPILGSVLGADAPRTNNCDMRSSGWEFEIAWRDHIGDFSYGAAFNISDATAKILTYPYDGAFENQNIYGYYNNKKFGEIWGYTTHGIAQSNEEMNAWIANNNPNWGSNWTAGDIMYTDLNGDNEVNPGAETLGDHGDLTVIGNSTPRYNFGLHLNAEWKGIDFSVFFQGVMKRDWWPGQGDPYFWGAQGNMWQSACFEEHLDYWSPENTGAYYPKPYLAGGIQKNQREQTKYLQSAAYMRCKNIQLGYTLPQNITMKAGINRARVYFSCDNLFTLTSLSSIFDPEALAGAWSNGKLYPLQRTFAFGVNVSF
ncbi:MAG: TonB-dependent receptor [Prevotella sp.]|nr:TonB-dependent receptor [Prevotella sp.]